MLSGHWSCDAAGVEVALEVVAVGEEGVGCLEIQAQWFSCLCSPFLSLDTHVQISIYVVQSGCSADSESSVLQGREGRRVNIIYIPST